MVSYPYTLKTESLKKFIGEIQTLGKPTTLSLEELSSRGYTSSNERAILPIMKFIGFVSTDGAPTDSWTTYRDESKARAAMAAGIKSGYSELFQTYPNANQQADERLVSFFRTKTTAGDRVVKAQSATFKTLCEFADFGAELEMPKAVAREAVSEPRGTTTLVASSLPASTGMTINLNIQLVLPTTENADIYDKIFESLRKHVLDKK